MRPLRFGEGFEPFGKFRKVFVSGGLGHPWIHLGVLIGLTFHGRLEISLGIPDRDACGRIANFL